MGERFWRGTMKPQRSEILGRMVRFLNLDTDGLRRVVLESIVEAQEFTVASIHESVCKRAAAASSNLPIFRRATAF